MFAMVTGMEYPKVIQMGLTVEQHRALRMKSFDEGRSMCALVRGWIEMHCGSGLVVKPYTKALNELQSKVDAIVSKSSPAPVSAPTESVYDDEVKMAKCRYCSEPFPVEDMVTEPKSGKLYCVGCVENVKNNQ